MRSNDPTEFSLTNSELKKPMNPTFEEVLREFEKTRGETITCWAAVAWGAKQLLDVTEIQIGPPKAGEVRVKVIANALCHTDLYTLEGHDAEGIFPVVLGHEATCIVESVGEGVTSVQVGDAVIPCYTPECRELDCIFCQSSKTNLCPKIRSTQGQGLMPDGTSRLSKDGKILYHFMGCSTFAEYAVIAEISAAHIHPGADLNKMCLLGCGVSTGWGAVFNTVKMEPLTSVVVFGLGALGLSVIQASKMAGARHIVGVDTNENKFQLATNFGAHECVNSQKCGEGGVKAWLMTREKWGYDYTFDCTGNVDVMRDALEVAHRGWGESCVIGVAAAGKEIQTRPFQLVTGRRWMGCAFGGWKSRTEVPKLVQNVMRGEMTLDPYITHSIVGLENVNAAIAALHSGDCIRAVVNIASSGIPQIKLPTLASQYKVAGGWLKQISHWSETCQCDMTFSIFLPRQSNRMTLPPVMYYLSGLTCTDENARTKSNFAEEAARVGLAVVFPDTSPRGVDIDGQDDSYDFGYGAGFYLNATTPKWSKHYNMYDYITKELPEVVASLFPVDSKKLAITGHSMGGLGALLCHLKNPGMYSSVSAFAPISNPTKCRFGQKAFQGYLGSVDAGKAYDATELIAQYDGPKAPILIDQGTADLSLAEGLLLPENFAAAAAHRGYPVRLRMQPNYDHSYYFVSSFMRDHIHHHAQALGLSFDCNAS